MFAFRVPHHRPAGDAVKAAPHGGRRPRAFTLVEVIVVLALLSLLGAIVLPNLDALVGGFGRATERAVILDQVAGLGERALLDGTGYVVTGSHHDDDEPPPARFSHYPTLRVDAPEGWRVVVAPPVVVHANGVCMGGVVRLGETAGVQEAVELRAPHCRVARTPGEPTDVASDTPALRPKRV